MKQIPLTQNQFALVDDEDYEWLSKSKWHAHRDNRTFYAGGNIFENGQWRTYQMHRKIMGLQRGDKRQIDHVNGNGLDNRRSNLRICTATENQHNRKIQKGTPCFKGVCWDKQERKWRASISVNSKWVYLGRFDIESDAVLAYDVVAKKLFGEFAKPNFPQSERQECI